MEKKTVLITDMDLKGRGIGKDCGKAVFISGAVIGDTVSYDVTMSKKRYDIGVLREIVSPSPKRCSPSCPHTDSCGGCVFSSIDRDTELDIKRRAVETAFRRAGMKDIKVSEIISGSAEKYRNKVVFHLGEDNKYGFFRSASKELFPIDSCELLPDIMCEIMHETEMLLCSGNFDFAPESIMIKLGSNGVMVVFQVANFGQSIGLMGALINKFPAVISAFECVGYPTDAKTKFRCVYGDGYVKTVLGDISLRISPKSFYQINGEIATAFCEKIVSQLAPPDGETILDLYCGIGTIGLYVAKRFPNVKVLGIEINDSAVKDATANAKLSGIGNAEFICSDAGSADIGDISPYALIVDPPRFGLSDSMIRSIVKFNPEKLIYMSCDPGTLAGDSAKLFTYGYSITDCIAGDMFPRSPHVETLCFFKKNG